jgi:hypothetical protein
VTIDLKSVDPKISGGKFSPNLHRWLKKERRHLHELQAFDSHDEERGGLYGRIYIGYRYDDEVHGSRLATVLGQGGRAMVFCFPGSQHWTPLEGWWDRYVAVGRCAIDPEHDVSFQQDHGPRYTQIGDVRTCNWCGAIHRRERYTETRVYERERFVQTFAPPVSL